MMLACMLKPIDGFKDVLLIGGWFVCFLTGSVPTFIITIMIDKIKRYFEKPINDDDGDWYLD